MNGLKRPHKEERPASNGHSIDYSEYSRSSVSSQPQQHPQKHPLFNRGVCSWPSCETSCDTMSAFLNHLNRDHVLNGLGKRSNQSSGNYLIININI